MIWEVLIVAGAPQEYRDIADTLRYRGFEVSSVQDAEAALDRVEREGLPHLAVIDTHLSHTDGLELARQFAERGAPVIITDDNSAETAIKGLKWADDYIRKPFAAEELAARIKRVLSRVVDYSYARRAVVTIDQRLEFDSSHDLLVVEGEPVNLTPTESRLLEILLRNEGRVVDSQSLLTHAWPGKTVYEDTLRVHIHRLRSKLEVDPRHPAYIRVVRGVGYIFQT